MSSSDELQGDSSVQHQVAIRDDIVADMSSDGLQGDNTVQHRAQFKDLPFDVTVKFHRNTLKLEASKEALKQGSNFFREHFEEHPAATTVIAPKTLAPGKTIKAKNAKLALDYLHGKDISDDTLLKDSIPLLLIAKALDIAELETQIKNLLLQKLIRQFELVTTELQVLELIGALSDLYEQFSDEGEVGNAVMGVVASAVAGACRSRIDVVTSVPEFDQLLRQVPGLAADIIAAGKGGEEAIKEGSTGSGGGLFGDEDEAMETVYE